MFQQEIALFLFVFIECYYSKSVYCYIECYSKSAYCYIAFIFLNLQVKSASASIWFSFRTIMPL